MRRSEPRLLLTCGLPGSGKTTLARRLAAERAALRLTKDEWQRALGSSPWDRTVGERVEAQLVALALETVGLGVDVVVDFGLWARAERDALRQAARAIGVGVELHVCEVAPDELWRRVAARNTRPPWVAEPISRAQLEAWTAAFEAPDDEERALFDRPLEGPEG